MRDIKFRGKVGNDWVYGSLITKKSNGETVYLIFDGKANHKVDPETVGQFSGLTDNKWQELWEGDVFENAVTRWIVEFNKGCFSAYIVGSKSPTQIALRAITGKVKVGNIHDNPDLLNPELLTQNSEQ